MPLQADTSQIKTVDTNNKIILDSSRSAPEAVREVDLSGRTIESIPENKVQEIKAPEEKVEVPKNPDQEARKLYLQAEKAKRKAAENLKKSEDSLKKAEAFEKAISLAQSGEDPTAVLLAAELDPVKFYRDMTAFALSDKAKKPEDPVQKELREHKERLDKYAKDLEVQATTIKQKEDLAAHNEVIKSAVIPLLNENPQKYETILLEYGANAAVEVYKAVWEIYQETGKARKFSEVADEMEKYWSDKVESGLNSASKLERFKNRFAQQTHSEPLRNPFNEQKDTSNRSPTLSNKQSIAPIKQNATKTFKSRDERMEEILKKFGG